MYEDEEYGFCPECGALMKTVCISCGYDRNKKDAKAEGAAETEALMGMPLNRLRSLLWDGR